MTMIQKYFPQDKNYILKEAQAYNQDRLLLELVEKTKFAYSVQCNPLGLVDETVSKIESAYNYPLEKLESFYLQLSGIYRYFYGADNQLQFMFDGSGHFDKYQNEWEQKFHQWTDQFCMRPDFIKAILEMTIFYPTDRRAQLGENKLNVFLKGYFDVKIRKRKGESAYKIA